MQLRMVLMALPFVSIPCTSAFSGVRYPVGYNPDLRLRPNYYPNTPLKSLEVRKKWTPPLGYDPESWRLRNTKDDEDLYTNFTDNTDTDSYETYDDETYDGETYDGKTYDDIKFKHGKYLVEGVWVGRAILRSHETISFDDVL